MAIGWHPFPMVRTLLAFAAGVWWGTYANDAPPFALLVFLLTTLGVAAIFRTGKWGSATLNLLWVFWLFLSGWSLAWGTDPLRHPENWTQWPDVTGQKCSFQGVLKEVVPSGEKWRMTVRVDSLAEETESFSAVRGDVLLYAASRHGRAEPLPGQRIVFSGKPLRILPPMDPLGFDWQWYQRVRGVSHQVFADSVSWMLSGQGHGWDFAVSSLRDRWERVLESHLEDPLSAQVAKALVLGSRSELDDALNEAYQASGSVHVLAVSGLHVGLVAGIVMGLLGLILRRRSLLPVRAVVAVPLVWGYVLLTGAADSALRAGVLFSVILLGKVLSRHAESMNLLAAAVLILLLYDPWLIHHAGFLLSVFAVAGIIYFHPLLYKSWFPGKGLPDFFWNLASVTLAAQAATLMLSLFYFHRFPVYFLLSGLFVVPVSSVLLVAGLALILCDALVPVLAFVPAVILQWSCTLMNALVIGIADLPSATLNGLWPEGFWTILLPVVLGWTLHALVRREGASFIPAAWLLSAGLAWQAYTHVDERGRQEWLLVRRSGESTRLLVRQGKDLLAWAPIDSTSGTTQCLWEGWGKVWELPRDADFRFGRISKSEGLLVLGEDTLSWGGSVRGEYHLGLPGVRPESLERTGTTLLLIPEMGWKDRRHWKEWAESNGLAVSDLRETGYFRRPL